MSEIPGYTLMRPLGRGGMGEVHLAVQQSLGREVALKLLTEALSKDPVACERFVREARIAANLRHPHIVPIYDVGVSHGTAYIAMEYESGGTVAALAREQLDSTQALRIARDIADALDYAHRQGVIHRDVKPENVLRRSDGLCLLSDFGIARAIEASTILTHEGASVGTPQYMSPEQLRGQSIDGRSDLYSLGVVLYQLLTGEMPYSGSDSYVLGMQHISAPIPRLPADLAHIQPLIDALMAKDPSARPQSGAEVVSRIDALLAGATPALTRPLETLETPSLPLRRRAPWLAGAAALLAALALSWYFIGQRALQHDAPPAVVATAAQSAPGKQGSQPQADRAATAPRSIAVLPFVNMSGEPENEFFSDGLSEEILNSLARIDNMQVVGRTSSFQFKGKNEDLRGVGEKLGVANLLEGSVRRSGERVRITAQLVRAADGIHLWSETYDRTLSDTLAVQLDIAEHVAGALDVVLDEDQRARMHEAGVKSVDAFIAFQKGLGLFRDAHDPMRSENLIATLRQAGLEFRQATALDPDFTAAYYMGTDLYSHIVLSDDATSAEREAAIVAARHDLDLATRSTRDPPEQLIIAVDRQLLSDDWHGLADRLHQAITQMGCRQSNWLSIGAPFGMAELRVKALRQRIACDPLQTLNYFQGTVAANWAQQPEAVLALVADGIRAKGTDPGLALQRIRALVTLGRIGEARSELAALKPNTAHGVIAQLLVTAALGEDVAAIREHSRRNRERGWIPELWANADALADALVGDRASANRRAAAMDALPGGALRLAVYVTTCECGAPFDLDATPNFKARLAESGLPWPPVDLIAKFRHGAGAAKAAGP